jgi:DNA repair protein RecO
MARKAHARLRPFNSFLALVPHHIYQTDGVVLASFAQGEGSAHVSILTEELGFIRAVAQAGREERSRMRYALQPYTRSSISLVRGRDMWRVTGARATALFHQELMDKRAERLVLERLTSLLRRLLYGEGQNAYLYRAYRNALITLIHQPLSADELNTLEALTGLRFLHALGYVSLEEEAERIGKYLDSADITPVLLDTTADERDHLRDRLKRALEASHL